jgi:hypothetical protein
MVRSTIRIRIRTLIRNLTQIKANQTRTRIRIQTLIWTPALLFESRRTFFSSTTTRLAEPKVLKIATIIKVDSAAGTTTTRAAPWTSFRLR